MLSERDYLVSSTLFEQSAHLSLYSNVMFAQNTTTKFSSVCRRLDVIHWQYFHTLRELLPLFQYRSGCVATSSGRFHTCTWDVTGKVILRHANRSLRQKLINCRASTFFLSTELIQMLVLIQNNFDEVKYTSYRRKNLTTLLYKHVSK